jgi:hypothetical protein
MLVPPSPLFACLDHYSGKCLMATGQYATYSHCHCILEWVSRIKQFPFDAFGCLSDLDCVIVQSNPKSEHEQSGKCPRGEGHYPTHNDM